MCVEGRRKDKEMVCRRKEERYGLKKERGKIWCVDGMRKDMVWVRKEESDGV